MPDAKLQFKVMEVKKTCAEFATPTQARSLLTFAWQMAFPGSS